MSQVADRSSEARKKLGHALGLLQESASHEVFITVAIPMARAMGALHIIEYSRGMDLATQGPIALRLVREALEALQANPLTGVIEEATGVIAGSLGLVHGLAQDAEAAALLAERVAADHGATSRPLSTTRPSVTPPSNLRQPKINVSIAPSPAAPSGGMDRTLQVRPGDSGQRGSFDHTEASAKLGFHTQLSRQTPIQSPPHARATDSRPQAGDLHSSTRISQPQPGPTGTQASAQYTPAPGAAAHPEGLQARRQFEPLYSSKNPPPPPGGIPPGAVPLVVSLGAYSPSNFYKGLSGNDVVDDGGLFVATYDIPALESSLWLTVHMPGGYEFEAHAIVKWTRSTGMGDAPPGYGCVFRSLSTEARQLVHRYARNREPIFHDDL